MTYNIQQKTAHSNRHSASSVNASLRTLDNVKTKRIARGDSSLHFGSLARVVDDLLVRTFIVDCTALKPFHFAGLHLREILAAEMNTSHLVTDDVRLDVLLGLGLNLHVSTLFNIVGKETSVSLTRKRTSWPFGRFIASFHIAGSASLTRPILKSILGPISSTSTRGKLVVVFFVLSM